MNMKVSDYICHFFVTKKIQKIFAISGAGNVHILNSIDNNDSLSCICPHHEQAGVMAALAYKRVSNKMGVMLTTQGGGSSNAITGVLNGWADSIPCLIISGQEKTQFLKEHKSLRMYGVQGFNVTKTVENFTKYTAIVDNPKMIKYHLEKAFYYAETGRPGPVWLDIPIDIQASNVDINELPSFEIEEVTNINITDDISFIIDQLKKSKRPMFIFGNGIRLSNCNQLLPSLLENISIPFLTAWNGIDMLPSNHHLYFGHEGNYGQRCANFITQNCDLLIAIGTRLAIPQIGYDINEFAREANKIVVDIDSSELSKFAGFKNFYTIEADAKYFIKSLISSLSNKPIACPEQWYKKCIQWKINYPIIDKKIHTHIDGYINSYIFVDELSKHFTEDEIIVTDMGTALTCTHQAITLNKNQRLITSTGLGEMGYGMPGAIGASFGSEKKRVILISGDGSMMMNLQELQTIVHHQLPIKIFLFINDGYLTIKHTQKALFGKKFVGSGRDSGVSCPDFGKVGSAFGLKTFKIQDIETMSSVIDSVLEASGPVICEVFTHPLQPLVPKLSFALNDDGTLVSPPLEDLYPFLPREILKQEMIIELLEKSKKIQD